MENKNLADYTDTFGFIYHHDNGDGSGFGDSAQRTGMAILFGDLYLPNKSCLHLIWDNLNKYGEPVRHWRSKFWPGRPGTMSRDNLIPMFCCLSLFLREEMWKTLWRIIKRGGFLWNTKKIGQQNEDWKIPDWCGPSFFFIALRSIPAIGFITAPIFDVYCFLSVLIRNYKASLDWDDVGDDLNLTVVLHACFLHRPTFLIKKVMRYYFNNRPVAGPGGQMIPEPGLFQAFRWYFHQLEAPPMDEIMIDAIKKTWPIVCK